MKLTIQPHFIDRSLFFSSVKKVAYMRGVVIVPLEGRSHGSVLSCPVHSHLWYKHIHYCIIPHYMVQYFDMLVLPQTRSQGELGGQTVYSNVLLPLSVYKCIIISYRLCFVPSMAAFT